MFNKILVPLDGSELAAKILPQVTELALTNHSEVTLLTVGNTSSMALIAEAAPSAIVETAAAMKAVSEKKLNEAAKELSAKGIKATCVYREGVPAKAIIDYADETGCDLIAMATHGRGEIAWIIGSVAEKVVTHATMPVFLWRVMENVSIPEKPGFAMLP